MGQKQYFTPQGAVIREQTTEEIDQDFELFITSKMGKLLLNTLQEISPSNKDKIKDILRKYYEP